MSPDESHPAPPVDVAGLLRRIRRSADLSQRELAARLHVSKSAVAAFESGTRSVDVELLAAAAALAGLRVALLDRSCAEVRGMQPGAVRDRAGRRFPAHLDTMLSEQRASRWDDRPRLRRPTYTFDRRPSWGDSGRRGDRDRPDDHLMPRPGDHPAERATARRLAERDARQLERDRRFRAGELGRTDDPFTCTCPPECDDLDDRSGPPVHAADCPCSCDVA
jgi:HTH-type transcriptional regulator/antitoxin HipB